MGKKRNRTAAARGVRCLCVDRREAGQRLDLFLVNALPNLSRKRAKRWIDQRRVAVDGRIEAMASRLLRAGAQVEVRVEEQPAAAGPPPLAVVYEDEYALALNKPPGIPSGPTRDPSRLHAEALAAKQFGARLTLLHRLDKDTSGVLLLAKTAPFARAVAAQFKQREVDKVYLALVSGAPPAQREVISHLREGEAGRMQTVRSGGMRAVTLLRRVARAGGVALVEARPRTGRTHQIRVHLARLGCPILGDSLYGGLARLQSTPLRRQMLHALSLSFTHPQTHARVDIHAPLPEDFLAVAEVAFGAPLPSALRDTNRPRPSPATG